MRLQRGFTLIELMITVAIVGILAAIAIPTWSSMVSKSRQTEAKLGLAAIYSLQTAYHGVANTYGSLAEIGFVSEGEGRYGYVISAESFVPPEIDVGTGGGSEGSGLWGGGNLPDPYGQNYGADDDDDDGESLGDDDDGSGGGGSYGLGNPHYDGTSFEVVAVGVISAAPSPNDMDVWSIDNFHTLENINPGF